MAGYLYILQEKGEQNYKIGFTTKPVTARRQELQTGNPRDLLIIAYFSVDTPKAAESFIHDVLGAYHIKREWFCVPAHELPRLIHYIEQKYRKYT